MTPFGPPFGPPQDMAFEGSIPMRHVQRAPLIGPFRPINGPNMILKRPQYGVPQKGAKKKAETRRGPF